MMLLLESVSVSIHLSMYTLGLGTLNACDWQSEDSSIEASNSFLLPIGSESMFP